jgi:hypothetical protein
MFGRFDLGALRWRLPHTALNCVWLFVSQALECGVVIHHGLLMLASFLRTFSVVVCFSDCFLLKEVVNWSLLQALMHVAAE